MNELIEKLKKKGYVRAFGLMTPEEQECFEKVGKKNCIYLLTNEENEDSWMDGKYSHKVFKGDTTYAIKPDYQPEPEYVDLEIERCSDSEGIVWLGAWSEEHIKPSEKGMKLPYPFTHLHCLPSLPGFDGFEVDGNTIPTEYVASNISVGCKVIAKFRKP